MCHAFTVTGNVDPLEGSRFDTTAFGKGVKSSGNIRKQGVTTGVLFLLEFSNDAAVIESFNLPV